MNNFKKKKIIKNAEAKKAKVTADKNKTKNRIIIQFDVIWMKDSSIKTKEKNGSIPSNKMRRNIKIHSDSKGIAVCKLYSQKNTQKEKDQIEKGNKVVIDSLEKPSIVDLRIYSVGSNNLPLQDIFKKANSVIKEKDKYKIADGLLKNKKSSKEIERLHNRTKK